MWYDISKLTPEQIQHVLVSDRLEGYSTKQIMDMYHMSFVDVSAHLTAYTRDNPVNKMSGKEIDALKREA